MDEKAELNVPQDKLKIALVTTIVLFAFVFILVILAIIFSPGEIQKFISNPLGGGNEGASTSGALKAEIGNVSLACTDSDGGIEPGIEAVVINASGYMFEDNCTTRETLKEYYCKNGQVNFTSITCANSCISGACSDYNWTCTDSDAGITLNKSGNIAGVQIELNRLSFASDSCLTNPTNATKVSSGGFINEYFCTGKYINSSVYGCSSGCLNGICNGTASLLNCNACLAQNKNYSCFSGSSVSCSLNFDASKCVDCRDNKCGNGICDYEESFLTCNKDCSLLSCGNGRCDNPFENEGNCPIDCKWHCGNGVCDDGENLNNCAVDCGVNKTSCGNGVCEPPVETLTSCAKDCNNLCSGGGTGTTGGGGGVGTNGVVGTTGGGSGTGGSGSTIVCTAGQKRCSGTTGYQTCVSSGIWGSTTTSCGTGKSCSGNGVCVNDCNGVLDEGDCDTILNGVPTPYGSVAGSGPNCHTQHLADAPEGAQAGDWVCDNVLVKGKCNADCNSGSTTGAVITGNAVSNSFGNSITGNAVSSSSDYCGDGRCSTDTCESIYNCPADCKGSICGNGICEFGETNSICSKDCKLITCGNGICDYGLESVNTCPQDCIIFCGNGVCESGSGENSQNCQVDCLGGICNVDDDCFTGMSCVNHACVPSSCTVDANCHTGERCINSVCLSECTTNNDCGSGKQCKNGFCSLIATLSVTQPNGGETLIRGQAYDVKWSVSTGVNRASVYLVSASGTQTTLASGTSASTGKYIWQVPSSAVAGQYKIKIVNSANAAEQDSSNDWFSISAPANALPRLNSITPVNGKPGDLVTIFGEGFDSSSNRVIFKIINSPFSFYNSKTGIEYLIGNSILSVDGRSLQFSIPQSLNQLDSPSDSSSSITLVPGNYQIIVSNSSSGGIRSNPLSFLVNDYLNLPSGIKITSPKAGDIWSVGDEKTITWNPLSGTGFNLQKVSLYVHSKQYRSSTNDLESIEYIKKINLSVSQIKGSLEWNIADFGDGDFVTSTYSSVEQLDNLPWIPLDKKIDSFVQIYGTETNNNIVYKDNSDNFTLETHVQGSCNECPRGGYLTCDGTSSKKVCNSASECLKWRTISCSSGQTCTNGECINSGSTVCTVGQKRCYGSGYQTCKTSNGSTSWSTVTPCSSGQTCSDGVCEGTTILSCNGIPDEGDCDTQVPTGQKTNCRQEQRLKSGWIYISGCLDCQAGCPSQCYESAQVCDDVMRTVLGRCNADCLAHSEFLTRVEQDWTNYPQHGYLGAGTTAAYASKCGVLDPVQNGPVILRCFEINQDGSVGRVLGNLTLEDGHAGFLWEYTESPYVFDTTNPNSGKSRCSIYKTLRNGAIYVNPGGNTECAVWVIDGVTCIGESEFLKSKGGKGTLQTATWKDNQFTFCADDYSSSAGMYYRSLLTNKLVLGQTTLPHT